MDDVVDLAEILNRIGWGDRSAWQELVRAQAVRLHAIALAITCDAGLAEDVVQETFLRIAEGRVPRLGAGAGGAFLGRMTSRAAIDVIRRRKARARREERVALTRETEPASPLDLLLSGEARLELRQAFALLPAETRAALWLHHVEGEGVRVVASALKCSASTAAKRIRNGLDRLKATLRGRGLAPAVAIPWPELLRSLTPRDPPPGLIERIESLGASVAPRSGALPEALKLGGLIMSGKKSAALLLVALLLFLGAAGWMARTWVEKSRDTSRGAGDGKTEAGPPVAVRVEGKRATLPPPGDPALAEPAPVSAPSADPESLKRCRGIVLDLQTGTPVPGARIAPQAAGKVAPAGAKLEAATGAEGTFELDLPRDLEGAFTVAADGYSSENFFPLRELKAVAIIRLNPRLEVKGWVVDFEDRPIEGAVVKIAGISIGASTTYSTDASEGDATTAEDGSFAIVPKLFGQPRLSVFKPGLGGMVCLGASPGAEGLMLRMPPGATVTGRVLDPAGGPVPAARVLWRTEDPNLVRWQGESIADGDGRFTIAGLPAPAEHWIFLADLSPHSSREKAEEALRAGRAELVRKVLVKPGEVVEELDLSSGALAEWLEKKKSPPASASPAASVPPTAPPPQEAAPPPNPSIAIRGKVLDPDGKPVARVYIEVKVQTDYSLERMEALSDANGEFRGVKADLQPAEWQCTLSTSHPAWARASVDLGKIDLAGAPSPSGGAPEIEVDVGEIKLVPGADIIGTAVDRKGQPLPGARVIVYQKKNRTDLRLLATTRSDGKFVLAHRAPHETLNLFIFRQDFAPVEIKGIDPSGAEQGTLDLGDVVLRSGGTVKGVVRGPDGSARIGSHVTLEGRFLQPPAAVDGAGQFVLEHVPAGVQTPVVLRSDDMIGGGLPLAEAVTVLVQENAVEFVELRVQGN